MNVLRLFSEMKRIFGFCPCCGDPFRLSDAVIYSREPPPKTDFDRIDDTSRRLERYREKIEDSMEERRQKARERGQRQARKALRRLVPALVGRGINLHDVKVVFDPVQYVVFRGLSTGGTRRIELVDESPHDRRRERAHESIRRCIDAGNVEWRTLRVDASGRIGTE